jgi:DNA primase catalytic subunit|tara:strand:+ start:180 stop:515 length:336 start_codon:yes stop_codon:yes gene_type:complete
MIWLYKAKNWIVAHKNWLVLVGLFILSYVLGRRSNQNYLEMANLAKDQYKKENEELERLQKAKQVRDKRAEQKAKAVKAALESEKEKRLKELEKQKTNPDDVFEDLGITKK